MGSVETSGENMSVVPGGDTGGVAAGASGVSGVVSLLRLLSRLVGSGGRYGAFSTQLCPDGLIFTT